MFRPSSVVKIAPSEPKKKKKKMGLEKLDFKIVKRYLGKIFGQILKANDVKHHISQMQPDLIIFKVP
jgi:hypothetical protein